MTVTVKVQNKKILFYFFGLLYVVSLQILYESYIYPTYHYAGFESDFNLFRCIVAYLFSILFLFLIQNYFRDHSLSKTVISLLLIGNGIPCLVLYIYMPADFILLILLFYFSLLVFYAFIPSIRIKATDRLNNSTHINLSLLMDIIFAFFAAVTVFIWAVYARFNIQFSFLDVYETRLAARTYNMPSIFSYLNTMSRNIIPIIAVFYLQQRKYLRFFFTIIVQFLIFSISANKSAVLSFAFAIGIYFIVRFGRDVIQYCLYVFSIGGFISIILNLDTIINLFYRRILFVPALLNYWYYDFFSANGLDYYAQSVGGLFGIESKYSSSLPFVIGNAYSTAETSANNGLFSDAYANLGIIGCIVMPLLLVVVLRLADGGSLRVPKAVWAAVAMEFFLSFNSSSFFTVLLTHGVLLIIILFYVIGTAPEYENNQVQLMEYNENQIKKST